MMPVLVHFELENKPALTPCLCQSLLVFLDSRLFRYCNVHMKLRTAYRTMNHVLCNGCVKYSVYLSYTTALIGNCMQNANVATFTNRMIGIVFHHVFSLVLVASFRCGFWLISV